MKTWNIHQEDMDAYLKVCKQAAEDDSVFASFKRNPAYTKILEHTSKLQGRIYFHSISLGTDDVSLFVKSNWHKFLLNDGYGDPEAYLYDSLKISPTTMQYIYVASKISAINGVKNICEIGGGYGGQCLVYSQCYTYDSYTIIDLPEAGMLQKKYLSKHLLKPLLFSPYTYPVGRRHDLVISNYALSEVTEPLQTQYVRDILLNSTHGYITCNGPIHAILELRDKFPALKITPDIEGERKENFIITW
jgi:hypothetical protein